MTKTQQARKPETPFKQPTWAWNVVPMAGIPTRTRSQSVVTDEEVKAGVKLVADYRAQEGISRNHDIEGASAGS
jgi:hypothetical protein